MILEQQIKWWETDPNYRHFMEQLSSDLTVAFRWGVTKADREDTVRELFNRMTHKLVTSK